MANTALTELEAVNLMLNAIDEAPVNSLGDTGLLDAVKAHDTLRNVSRSVQEKGWKWNTLFDYTLSPTAPLPGQIPLPANTLRVDATKNNGVAFDKDVYDAGGYLYDVEENTDLFSASINCDIVIFKDFEDLPSPARSYIAARAAREFQQDRLGAVDVARLQGVSEADALATLNKMETSNANVNVFRGSYSMARIFKGRR